MRDAVRHDALAEVQALGVQDAARMRETWVYPVFPLPSQELHPISAARAVLVYGTWLACFETIPKSKNTLYTSKQFLKFYYQKIS